MNSRGATSGLPRAGFWRRWLSLIIDILVVIIPFQMLAAVLFVTSAGMIQMNTGLFQTCETGKTIPQGLDPPPPQDSNFFRVCETSFFGATTGAMLTVGRVTGEGNNTTRVVQTYMLDEDGATIKATSIDWIYQLCLTVYLVVMIWKTGRTLGGRIAGIRVVDTRSPETSGVPLGKTIIRYLAILIGAVPALALLVYAIVAGGDGPHATFTPDLFRLIPFAAVIGGIWAIVLIVQVALKTDPIYDRLAGTAVLVVPKKASVPPALPQGA
jgi:RDD family